MQRKFGFKVITFFVVAILFCSYGLSHSYAAGQNSLLSQSTKKQVVISSDPRIELISVLQMLIGAWPMTTLDFDYMREVQDTFYPHYQHPVVRQFAYMWYMYGFSQEIPSTCMLHLSEPPELKVQIPFTKEIIDRAGGERSLNDFLALLRDFAEKTDFMYFYQDHLSFYESIVELAEKKLETKNTIPMLEDYFGFSDRSYELILVPLFHENGYSTHVSQKYYALLGPYDVDEQKNEKLPYWKDSEGLHKQLLKSFSYAFVHPFVRQNNQLITGTEKLLIPIRRKMMYVDIQTWSQCFTEHIVRTISQRFTLQEYGEKDWEEQRQKDVSDSFVYIDYIEKWLQNYENNRSFFSTFDDFFPVLLNNIQTLCEYPFIPTELTIINASENGVQLAWINNAIEPNSVSVLRRTKKGEYTVIHEMEDPQIQAWTDSSVERGKHYIYAIAVKGDKGEIISVGTTAVIPANPPLAPIHITATVDEATVSFSFMYPFKAEGFALFEWNGKETNLILTKEYENTENQTLIVENLAPGKHTFYICSYITIQNNDQEDEILYSAPSPLINISIQEK